MKHLWITVCEDVLFSSVKHTDFNDIEEILMVQSCKLYNNKYMITSTQITNTKISASIGVFKLLSCKVLFITEKTIETDKK